MINKRIWEELSPKWPKGYWDDWLREPENRKGRHTLHPEICRTYHFGEKGTSNSQYSSYLTNIHLNSDFTPFSRLDLSYLTASGWDLSYYQPISHLPLLLSPHHVDSSPNLKEVKIEYDGLSRGPNCFEKVARAFGIMDNIKVNYLIFIQLFNIKVISFLNFNFQFHFHSSQFHFYSFYFRLEFQEQPTK